MQNKKPDWIKNPTKKQVLIVFFTWVTGIILLTLSMTNLFTENPLKGKYAILYLLIITATITMISVCINYFKNKRSLKNISTLS
jgi:hypothetical protein